MRPTTEAALGPKHGLFDALRRQSTATGRQDRNEEKLRAALCQPAQTSITFENASSNPVGQGGRRFLGKETDSEVSRRAIGAADPEQCQPPPSALRTSIHRARTSSTPFSLSGSSRNRCREAIKAPSCLALVSIGVARSSAISRSSTILQRSRYWRASSDVICMWLEDPAGTCILTHG
jgi:hypothetical protein